MPEPDYNEIPAFLKRPMNGSTDPSDDKGGSQAAREEHGQSPMTLPAFPEEPHWRKLYPLTPRDLEVIAELQSKTQTTEKDESYARINKLKASKADRAAAAAGKTWDAINGGWK